MTITAAHVLLYSTDADATRAVLRDVLGTRTVDAGGGWLIFQLPPAEVGVHPTDGASQHQLSLVCDDIASTVDELRAKGVEILREPRDDGFGVTVDVGLPGGVQLQVYEPRHPLAATP